MIASPPNQPTLWGLTPVQLHDRFWASRGVQAVRQGEPSDIVAGAELYLLTDARSLTLFELPRLLDILCWTKPELLYVRLTDRREHGYGERVVTDAAQRFVSFKRIYEHADWRLGRIALTRDLELALLWQSAADTRAAWKLLRRHVPLANRAAASEDGSVYDRSSAHDLAVFTRQLVQTWQRPNATIRRATHLHGSSWADKESFVDRSTRFIGPVWVGAGRRLSVEHSVVGPSVLWDEPAARPAPETVQWSQIEPTASIDRKVKVSQASSLYRASKRLFDIAFAMTALLLTLPLYLLVIIAIWIEDGRPFFFAHQRETVGGRPFPCIKFRSMRKDADAEKVKQQLAQQNQADGPQFFIAKDPRMTYVGRFIRACNIDELPQFINVLLGHMSVVGPRPSPSRENQFCPSWREARLSVRPGITGMWQVKRTRQPGLDFQEWIKYDMEYVENAGWGLDLWLIYQTIRILL